MDPEVRTLYLVNIDDAIADQENNDNTSQADEKQREHLEEISNEKNNEIDETEW